MPETPEPAGRAPAEEQATLQNIAQLLRDADHLGPEAQQALADLVDELAGSLAGPTLPPPEAAHLAASTAHLVEAVRHQHNAGVLSAARARVAQAIVSAEVRAPVVSGVARRLLEALSNLGI